MATIIFKLNDDEYTAIDPYFGGCWSFNLKEIRELLQCMELYRQNNGNTIAQKNYPSLCEMMEFIESEGISLSTSYLPRAILTKLDNKNNPGILVPPEIVLEVNRKCTYRCPWCYIPKMEESPSVELSLDELKRNLIVPMVLDGALSWTLTGGEPSVTPNRVLDIARIINETTTSIWGENPRIDILSNGYRFSEYAEQYMDNNIRTVQFQLSSPYEEEEIRLRAPFNNINSFQHVIDGMEAAKRLGFSTSINMVIEPRNANSVKDMILLVHSLNTNWLRITPAVMAGKAKENNIHLGSALYSSIEKQIQQGRSIIGENMTMDIYFPAIDLEPDRPMWCGLGYCDFYVAYNGDVYPCNNLIEPELVCDPGTIREISAVNIWYKSNVLKQFRHYYEANISDECGKCGYRGICVGNCIARCWHQFGSFDLLHKSAGCFADENKEG